MSRYIFYDLETTGLNPAEDNIIEIGARDNENNEFNKLINPGYEISKTIRRKTIWN